jgi:hypothetical protein
LVCSHHVVQCQHKVCQQRCLSRIPAQLGDQVQPACGNDTYREVVQNKSQAHNIAVGKWLPGPCLHSLRSRNTHSIVAQHSRRASQCGSHGVSLQICVSAARVSITGWLVLLAGQMMMQRFLLSLQTYIDFPAGEGSGGHYTPAS